MELLLSDRFLHVFMMVVGAIIVLSVFGIWFMRREFGLFTMDLKLKTHVILAIGCFLLLLSPVNIAMHGTFGLIYYSELGCESRYGTPSCPRGLADYFGQMGFIWGIGFALMIPIGIAFVAISFWLCCGFAYHSLASLRIGLRKRIQ